MHRTPQTRRLIVRIAATAAIALAPLAITAAPALAEAPAPNGVVLAEAPAPAPNGVVEDVSRPGRHGHNGFGRHDRGWGRHDRGQHSWNGWFDDGVDWDRGHRNRNRHGWNQGWNNGWNDHGWNHGRGWNRGWNQGHGLPLPRIYLPGTGSAF
ncbi:hypothetical protein [Nocardia sp. NPDC024068]|uniref:hypothetical protein n=1 Tax=Nocardia sp. NPDC024068 TaxID=3157197 RepID=UPI0033F41248